MRAKPKYLPLLVALFAGSGCAALIYEIVWFQMLQLVVGSSAISLGILLGTFMAGMCVGSVTLSRVIATRHHPLRVYALLELGIGIMGIALLSVLPLVGKFYIGAATQGLWGHLLRGLVCAVCLFPPTVLMGATLPAIARWTASTRRGVSWLGFFYGGNIVGAVCGCLFAGFLPPAPLRRGHRNVRGSRAEHRRGPHRVWLGAPRRIRRNGRAPRAICGSQTPGASMSPSRFPARVPSARR